ncbi:inactive LRR receptor-like serine/threonine-protein kinase BIR2 [Zingiber officinale]|nr:inactive LRR receptor-like serine/threonine-protein kinase BIR2 [Zingiber officinale]XP_042379487.1 inactive LRR receptor-like serine/threonine-protein kinase BIR2 [Zingiber officinale]XP_042379488.1 inactive LRR receptor-like serine/threonine-protein kinase BIR2 [Zingiber officinale]
MPLLFQIPITMTAFLLLLLLLLLLQTTIAQEDDVRCLRGVKAALDAGNSSLQWNFSNTTVGFVCSFVGVSCWNPQENRVLGFNLRGVSLAGSIPSDIRFCASANTLDLSSNALSGPIPSQICSWLPYLVSLDLSDNQFNGTIPPELSDCRFLNILILAGNQLQGGIPPALAELSRLNQLDLSRNRLSGPILPSLGQKFDSSSFEDNDGLCGRPVSSRCGRSLSTTRIIIIVAAGVFGAAASLVLAYLIWRCWTPTLKRAAPRDGEEGSRWWAERLRAQQHRLTPVSLFQKPIKKVRLADLMAATADFHRSNIIVAGSSRAGTAYKALLRDGSALTVKRLHSCTVPEKQFHAEMEPLGQLRHPNLVPLLGFCLVEDERLLIYKYMPNGSLASALQSPDVALDWPARVRIAVGAARGLAWLHHGFQIPFLLQNLSSKSILLDDDYEARITDFGIARLVRTSTSDSMHTSQFLNGEFGEFGYTAPEYSTNPDPTPKCDVYAFGVVLLELVSGKAATELDLDGEEFKGTLVDWVNMLSANGKDNEAIDRSLLGKGKDDEMMQVLKIASACVVAQPKERPSMYKVSENLKLLGESYDCSEQFDEFPLVYGKDESDLL